MKSHPFPTLQALFIGLFPAALTAQDLARDLMPPGTTDEAYAFPTTSDAYALETPADVYALETTDEVDLYQVPDSVSAPQVSDDVFAPEVTAPSGFSGVPVPGGGYGETFSDNVLDGWSYGVSTSLYYTDNVSQSGRGGFAGVGPRPGAGGGSDTVLSVSTNANYRSPNPDRWIGASVNLGYAHYFSNSDFSGPIYGAGLQGGFGGGKITGSGSLSVDFNRGGNRNVGGFTEQLSVGASLSLNYRYSAKTSFSANYGTQLISAESGNATDSNSHRFSLMSNWKASPLTSIGAGVAASFQGGGAREDRTTVGPTVSVNYKLSQKLALNSSFGLDFVTGGSDTDSVGYDVRIGANYRASELWGMDITLFGGTVPDNGFGGGFRDTWSLRLGYNRRILGTSQLNLGVRWETSSQNTASRPAATNGDRDTLVFDASLSRPIPVIRGSGSIFFSWQDQSGNAATSFDGYTVGVSASATF